LKTFKTKSFARFARKERIADARLLAAVEEATAKRDADLGGEVIKQRVAREGQGKSGGYRTIVLFRRGKRAIFVHGFAKSDADNISSDELKAFKKLAAIYLELTEEQIAALIEAKELMEVK
jgi:hypothetical protein